MFISIKYGQNEETMVNINCKVTKSLKIYFNFCWYLFIHISFKIINLLRYLKNFPGTADLDLTLIELSDLQGGKLY